MAAIFPTGSSREPIAFLQRALRRQLSLKNCLCHVRHIFLAFPLFSSLAPGVPGLSRLSRPHGQPLASSLRSRLFPVSRLFLYHLRAASSFRISYFLCTPHRPWPPLHPSCTYSSSSFSAASAAAAAALFRFFQLSFLFYHSFLSFFFSPLLFFPLRSPLRIPIVQRGIIVFIPEVSSIERQVADLNNARRNVSRASHSLTHSLIPFSWERKEIVSVPSMKRQIEDLLWRHGVADILARRKPIPWLSVKGERAASFPRNFPT